MSETNSNSIFNKLCNNYILTLQKVFDYKGRANKFEYWGFVFINLFISYGLSILGMFANVMTYIATIFSLGIIIPQLALFVRRLHDRNRSGKILWIGVLAFVLIMLLSILQNLMDYQHVGNERAFWKSIIISLSGIVFICFVMYIVVMPILPSKENNKYGEKIEQTKAETYTANALIVIYYLVQVFVYVTLLQANKNLINDLQQQSADTLQVQSQTVNINENSDFSATDEDSTSIEQSENTETDTDTEIDAQPQTENDAPAAPVIPMNVSVEE